MTDRVQAQARALATQLRDLDERVTNLANKPGLAYSSIEGGRIEDYDTTGTLRGMVGTQPDGTHTVASVNGPTPPRPTAPTCAGGQGTIKARWDGLFLNDAGDPDELVYVPSDFARVEAHASQEPDFTALFADTLLGTIETPRGADVTTLRAPGTWYVKLVARSQSGKASAASPAIQVQVQDLVDVAEVDAQLAKAAEDLAAASTRLDDDEARLDDVFGQVAAIPGDIDAARSAAIAAAAADAQTKADAALAAANAQVAQVIARGISLVRNGDFEAGQDGWQAGASSAVEVGVSRSGGRSLRIGPNPGGDVYPVSDLVPASSGRTWYLEAWVQRSGTEAVSPGVGFLIQAKTAAGGTSNTVVGQVAAMAVGTAGWTKLTATASVATADVVAVRFAPWVAAGSNVFHVDDMLVVDVTEAKVALDSAASAGSAASAAQAAAGSAQSTADSALTMAGSKGRVFYSTSAPSGSGTATGDLWRQVDASSNVIAEWYWTKDGAWQATAISSSAISNLDVGKLTAGTAVIVDVVAQKIAASTATFQKADVANLTAGTGTMAQAVIDQLYADVVKSRKISTDMLAANSVTTTQLAATAIDGMTITGATIQTAKTTTGVKITSQGMYAYDANGVQTVRLNGSDNKVVGRFSTAPDGKPGMILTPTADGGAGLWFSPTGSTAGTEAALFTDPSSQNITIRPQKRTTPNGSIYFDGNTFINDGFDLGGQAWTLPANGFATFVGLYAKSLAAPYGQDLTMSAIDSTKSVQVNSNLYANADLWMRNAPTTSAAANMLIATNPAGRVYRSTSSRRYKKYVQDYGQNPLAVMGLRPRTWVSKKQPGEEQDPRRYTGFIAEEMAEVAPEFVSYCDYDDGAGPIPESVDYDRITALLVRHNQALQTTLDQVRAEKDELAAKVALLEDRLTAIDARLAAIPAA
ncbi:tail fiber domain-containing protein [Tersicoccus sp. Bi-70]|uniref:tail fiber domain-containing protein n=1 Tax=Tersicoccus sp. Bi-70 TaxID=1897634 RepID=UPI0009777EEA|nr:tail fiber domain-containing protein [Tersicoccus sp. Bi-70]OMH30661.1 hypothetical protein BGP79_11930 [Tersicoccus sp. Bi-70]